MCPAESMIIICNTFVRQVLYAPMYWTVEIKSVLVAYCIRALDLTENRERWKQWQSK